MFVGFSTIVIGDIDLAAQNVDVTQIARYTGFQDKNALAASEPSYINIDNLPQGATYLEFKLAKVDQTINLTVYDNVNSNVVMEEKVGNGRNFIALQGEFQNIQLQFEPNTAFELLAL